MEVEAIDKEVRSLVKDYLGGLKNKAWKLGGVGALAGLGAAAAYLIVGIFALEPVTLCGAAGTSTGFVKCTESRACDLLLQGTPALIKFDYDNWTQQYNMVCENAGKRQFAKSLFLFISYFGAGLVLSLTECVGMKRISGMTALIAVGGCGLGVFADDYTLKLAGFGLAHSTFYIYSSLFTIAFSELLPSESPFHSCGITTSLILLGISGIIYSAVVLGVQTSPTVLAWVTLVTTVVTSFLPVVVMPESPFFLLRKKETQELCQVVKEIRANKSDSEVLETNLLIQIETLAEKRALLTSIEQARYSFEKERPVMSERASQPSENSGILVARVIMLWLIVSISRISLHTETMGFESASELSWKSSTLVLYIAATVWLLVYGVMRTVTGSRAWLMVYLGCMVFGGVLLVVFGKMGMLDGHNTGQKLLNLFITVGIIGIPSFVIFAPSLIYISQNFPTEVSGTATSVIFLISNCLALGTPQIAKYSEEHYGHFASAIALSAFVPLIILKFQASNTDR